MPVGTRGAVKAMTTRDLEDVGRRRSSSATPITCTCGPGDELDRAARRAAPVHRLAAPDPHRQRRLPGVQPGGPAHDHRGGRRVPVAPRRQPPPAHAGDAPSTSRRTSAPTSRWCSTSARRTRRPTTTARASMERTAALGAARPRPLPRAVARGARAPDGDATPARCSSASCRAACTRDLRAESAGADARDRLRGVRHRRAERRRAARGDVRRRRRATAAPARRPAPLPDGDGHARRPRRVRGAGHRHVRLRAADPERPQRPVA